jgi:hypothetical protein
LNIHEAGGVGQTEMYTTEPFLPRPIASETEVAIGNLERCKSPGIDQIPSELIQAGGETLRSEIHVRIKYDLEQRVASPEERIRCRTYSQKRIIGL